jgi:hypothetical protein
MSFWVLPTFVVIVCVIGLALIAALMFMHRR